jgi:monovalent cation:H+ antiporter, CPA1 family
LAEEYDMRIAAVKAQRHLISEALTAEDLVAVGLRIMATREGELAFEKLEAGILPRSVADSLIEGAGRLGDAAKVGGLAGYEQGAQSAAGFDLNFRIARWMHQQFGIERPLAGALAERFERLLLERMMLVDLGKFVDRQLGPILGGETAATLHQVLDRRGAAVEQALAALRLQYPDYAELLESRYLGRVSLRLEEDAFRGLLEESVVSQEIFNDLDRQLSERRRQLERRPSLDVAMDPEALIAKVPLFADLAPERRLAIARLLKPRLALPGERIVAKGERGDAMYFITSGAVGVAVGAGEVRLGSGDFFGEIALVAGRPRTADVRALGYCSLPALFAGDLDRLLAEDADMRRTIDDVARQRLGVS